MITVALTRADLVEKRVAAGLEKACQNGLDLFDALKAHCDEQRARDGKPRRRGIVIRWSRVHALWMATAYPSHSAWMIGAGLLPAMGFADADLRGAHLRGAHLGGADLRGADLRGAYLGDWERGPDGYARRKA